MILVKIALRNIRQHKAKTLIIGSLIALGIMFLVIGNSLMDTAQMGIEKMYIDNYTGSLFLHAETKKKVTLFGAIGSDMTEMTIDKIDNYQEVTEYLDSRSDVITYTPQIIGFGMVSFVDKDEEQKGNGVSILWGIDAPSYQKMFTENIDLLSGSFPAGTGAEILLSKEVAKDLEKDLDREIHPGDKIMVTGIASRTGAKIREVKVAGTFSFKQSNMQLDMVSLVDPVTAGAITGLNVGAVSKAVLTPNEQEFLNADSTDDMFTGDLFTEPVVKTDETDTDIYDILGDPEAKIIPEAVSGAWHFLLVRLKDGASIDRFKNDLAAFSGETGIDISASGWRDGAGVTAEMSYGMQAVFNVIILVISIVAIIIIMNTLVISVTERIPEIGTIRAIGGQKNFVRGMIVWETLLISGLFGLIGIGVGAGILGVLNATGIEAGNMFLELIFGGKVLHPVISLSSIGTSLVVIVSIGIISSLYPTTVALKIEPVKAMRKG